MAILDLWERDRFRSPEVAAAACEESQSPAVIKQVLERVRRFIAATEGEEKRLVIGFFYRPAQNLCRKMADPEPLLNLAVESGAWSLISGWACRPDLKERYLLAGITRTQSSYQGQSLLSLSGVVSRESVPTLREAMRKLWADAPLSAEFGIAVRTLVDFEDIAIVPDLEGMLAKQDIYPEQRATLELYLAKLKHQHSKDALLGIARTERENDKLLRWAVKRLLWLRMDRKTIHDALAENRRLSKSGHDIAKELETYIRSYEDSKASRTPLLDADSLILDGNELTSHRESLRHGHNATEMTPHFNRLSLRSLVTSAPSGD